jgi:uncharacterized protein (TIGR02996 family)
MTDQHALLAAIRQNPDDDTPRLVYADWLQEHDQPERAEFIRLQCEKFRLLVTNSTATESEASVNVGYYYAPRWVRQSDLAKYKSLRDREQTLARNHCRSWEESDELYTLRLAGKSAMVRVPLPLDWQWERGFIEEVKGTVVNWLVYGDKFANRHPVRRVYLTTRPSEFEQLTIGRLDADRVYYRVAGRVVDVPQDASVNEILAARWKGVAFEFTASAMGSGVIV